jgi:amino acid permease
MADKNKKFFQATAVMIGYIVGVGMFGLPYLVSQAGIVPFLVFVSILLPAQYLLHLIYASMILSTEGYHRLPGHAGIYLGPRWKIVVFIGKFIGSVGALLAYIIITGIFVNNLLAPVFGFDNVFFYASLVFAVEATIVYFGTRLIAKTELAMTIILMLVTGLIVYKGWPHISSDNYNVIDWKYALLPYGALLFSLDGNGSLPVVAKLVKRDPRMMKNVVRWGTLISALITIVFTLTISGISGAGTTPDALTGIHKIMNGSIALALVFGIFSMVTSFFGVAQAAKETLHWDFKINRRLSWAMAVFLPYGLYISGVANLVEVISFVGAIGGGICAIALVVIFEKMRRQGKKLIMFKSRPPKFIDKLLIFMFILGMAYTIWEYLLPKLF